MLRLFSVHLEAFTVKKEVAVKLLSHTKLFDEMSLLHKLIPNPDSFEVRVTNAQFLRYGNLKLKDLFRVTLYC